jgi:hypothetical protein
MVDPNSARQSCAAQSAEAQVDRDAIIEWSRLEGVAATICSALGVPHADLPGRALLQVGEPLRPG